MMRTAIRTFVVLATMLALLAPGATLVSAASISATPNTGAVGATVVVGGPGFAANTTVRVFFNGSGGSLIGAETADASGNLNGFNVVIPSVPGGTYQIFATDGTNTATTNFTVPAALTLTPTSGGPGTSVAVNGTGFLSGEAVSIAWDQAGNQVASTTANSNGVISTTFSVPSSSGMHTVVATGQSSHFAQSATFTVSGNVGPANLSVNPTFGAVPSTVTLNGTGFSANEQVNIAVDNGGTMSVTADGSGNFSISLGLSSSLALGGHTISASGASSGRIAFAVFSVTGSATGAAQAQQAATSACVGDDDDSRPGNGFGDSNHCHTGPPGHGNDGGDNGGHGRGHGRGDHGNGNDQGEDN
jgi:large repetitive protein